MAGTKWVEYDLHIDLDGTCVTEVTAKETGANCAVVRSFASGLGKIIQDETTGPLCDNKQVQGN